MYNEILYCCWRERMRTTEDGFRWFVLAAVGIVATATSANMYAFAPILGDIARDLHISVPVAQSSFLGSYMAIVAVSVLVFGALEDRFGIVPVLLLGGLIGFVPNLLFPMVGFRVPWVMALRVLQGSGEGAAVALIPLCAAHWFPEQEKGRVAGVGMTLVNAGFMAGVFLSPILYQWSGNWRAPWDGSAFSSRSCSF